MNLCRQSFKLQIIRVKFFRKTLELLDISFRVPALHYRLQSIKFLFVKQLRETNFHVVDFCTELCNFLNNQLSVSERWGTVSIGNESEEQFLFRYCSEYFLPEGLKVGGAIAVQYERSKI